jgi:hypothetical protein
LQNLADLYQRNIMRRNLSITRLGLSLSAVMAVPYVLVMFASLLLVGKATNGSWQATFLGITWNTMAGFELGLTGIVIGGFAIAFVLVPVYNIIGRQVTSQTSTSPLASHVIERSVRFGAFRLLAALFVLLPLSLLVLRILTPLLASGIPADSTGANAQIRAVNLGSAINTPFREAEPSFTADGRTMYFNCHNVDICVSHLVGTWEEGTWTAPEIVPAPISTEFEEVEPIINPAGNTLYFTSTRPARPFQNIAILAPFINVLRVVNMLATGSSGQSLFSGVGLSDVWVSYQIDGAWSQPQNINDLSGEPAINTPYEDHCLFFSTDGNEAFWTSTRPGGFGDNDIWTSRRVAGKWTEPENLGSHINGPGSEHTSIPTPDGKSLYVTTTRADGFGGEDSYVTTRTTDGTWGPLINLGPLINGPGDDRCPAWTPDQKIFLFDAVKEGGFGGRDIWWVYFRDLPGQPSTSESAAAVR